MAVLESFLLGQRHDGAPSGESREAQSPECSGGKNMNKKGEMGKEWLIATNSGSLVINSVRVSRGRLNAADVDSGSSREVRTLLDTAAVLPNPNMIQEFLSSTSICRASRT